MAIRTVQSAFLFQAEQKNILSGQKTVSYLQLKTATTINPVLRKYTVTVTDANGCEATLEEQLKFPNLNCLNVH